MVSSAENQKLLDRPTLLGGLNPELYRISVETPEEEVVFPDGHVGRVWIGLQYDSAGERLLVSLIKVKNLPSRVYGCNNCCDPFVRNVLAVSYVALGMERSLRKKLKPFNCLVLSDQQCIAARLWSIESEVRVSRNDRNPNTVIRIRNRWVQKGNSVRYAESLWLTAIKTERKR
ncbi:uncharacterized protein TNCV_1186841 [Trichonephila clavipes]|nr:uncharacterized protein TNCV_1186841 [Trichonephila clavipes]